MCVGEKKKSHFDNQKLKQSVLQEFLHEVNEKLNLTSKIIKLRFVTNFLLNG